MLLSPQQCQVWRFQWLRAVCCVPAYIAQEKRHSRYTKQCRWTINTFFQNGMKSPLSLIPHQKSKNVISLFTNGFTLVLEVLMPHWKCISPQCLGGSWSQIFMEGVFRHVQDEKMIQGSQHSFTQGTYAWPVWWPSMMGWLRQWSREDWPVSSTWSSVRLSVWSHMASLTPNWRDVDWKGGLFSGWGIDWMDAEVISSSMFRWRPVMGGVPQGSGTGALWYLHYWHGQWKQVHPW